MRGREVTTYINHRNLEFRGTKFMRRPKTNPVVIQVLNVQCRRLKLVICDKEGQWLGFSTTWHFTKAQIRAVERTWWSRATREATCRQRIPWLLTISRRTERVAGLLWKWWWFPVPTKAWAIWYWGKMAKCVYIHVYTSIFVFVYIYIQISSSPSRLRLV